MERSRNRRKRMKEKNPPYGKCTVCDTYAPCVTRNSPICSICNNTSGFCFTCQSFDFKLEECKHGEYSQNFKTKKEKDVEQINFTQINQMSNTELMKTTVYFLRIMRMIQSLSKDFVENVFPNKEVSDSDKILYILESFKNMDKKILDYAQRAVEDKESFPFSQYGRHYYYD